MAGQQIEKSSYADITLSPACRFNVYVTQPEVKPGCVLRRANIGLLEKKKLVTDREVIPSLLTSLHLS